MHTYKRKKIDSKAYLLKVVHYIHHNALAAKLCREIEHYPYSSYNAIVTETKTLINKTQVIAWFDDINNFKYVHSLTPSQINIELF